jgi:hypothetical protein
LEIQLINTQNEMLVHHACHSISVRQIHDAVDGRHSQFDFRIKVSFPNAEPDAECAAMLRNALLELK